MKDYKKCNYNGKRIYAHRAIAMATLGMVLGGDMIVHHKDGNKFNNDPSNLVVMTNAEHSKYHSMNQYRLANGRFGRKD